MKNKSVDIDQSIRSWTKSFTWRFIGMLILLPLTYVFTGKWENAAAITLSFHLIRMILFYFHERLWEKTDWGRTKNINKKPFYISLAILILSFLLVILFFGK